MSSTEALDLFGRSQRQASWRFILTNQGGDPIGELGVDRDSAPTISVDTGRPSKRTLQRVNLPPGEIHNINVVTDRLQVSMILSDGSVHPQGLYLFTASTHEALGVPLLIAHEHHAAHLDLIDQTLIVDQLTDQSYTARPHTLLTDLIQEVLSGLPVIVEVSSSGVQVGLEAIAWPAGTNRLRIVNELAAMLGYHDLYFDNTGIGRLGPMPDPALTDAAEVIDFFSAPRVYRPSLIRSDDLLELPNRFVVIGSGASETSAVGVYTLPANAPHSIANRGFAVTHSEQLQGMESQDQAYSAAVAISRQYRFAHETIDFNSPPDPRHDHYNTISIENVRYLEVAWTMSLQEGAQMQHTARRTYSEDDV